MKVFFVEFTITPVCNQDCYYCDLERKDYQGTWEADIDYFKWIVNELGSHTQNLMIELCGGEPGLCSNLESFISFLRDHKSVKLSQLMSNGLVRMTRPDLIKEVTYYNEHLVKEIVGTTQHLFYPMDHVDTAGMEHPNAKSVIVTTPTTTKSLLDNFDHFRWMGLFDDNMWIKPFVERTINITHKNNLIELYTRLGKDYVVNQLQNTDKGAKAICARRPFLPNINLQRGTIQHCAYKNFTDCVEVLASAENLEKLVNKMLFMSQENPTYCENCYLYSRDKMLLLMGNKCNRKI
jgi:hypothetical protein